MNEIKPIHYIMASLIMNNIINIDDVLPIDVECVQYVLDKEYNI